MNVEVELLLLHVWHLKFLKYFCISKRTKKLTSILLARLFSRLLTL